MYYYIFTLHMCAVNQPPYHREPYEGPWPWLNYGVSRLFACVLSGAAAVPVPWTLAIRNPAYTRVLKAWNCTALLRGPGAIEGGFYVHIRVMWGVYL